MLTHMEKKWRISAKSRYMPTTTTSSSGESPSGQTRGTLSSMSRFVRFFSIGFMILVVLPKEIQATVYMINQCGRTIHSAGDLIFSQGGLYYPSNTNCTVTIATLSGEGRVLLQLHDSELNSNEDCSDDYLELSSIKAKDDNGNSINTWRICGSTSPMEVMSDGPSLRIQLVSDGVGSGRGWSGAFANILPVDIPLCLGYERFQCHNRRCIPSVLRCDSVNHCGDNSDETFGCKDDLPYYFGDRVLEQEEAIYIGVAVAFTALFAIFFASVCTRDTCKQIKRRVKKLMTRSREEYNESFEKDLEAELRKALMARSMYDRRVSQPYDSTLNTITGGELARQLKLELRKIQQNGGSNGYQLPDPQSSTQRSVNGSYDKINSTSELIHLMNFDRKNNNHSDQGSSNKAHFLEIPQKSERRVSIESIPSVVVSEDGDELKREVLYDPKEVFSKGEAKNLSRGLYQKRLSRSSTSSLNDEQSPSEIGATLTNGNKISMSSRFSVTAVPEDKSLAKSEGASMSNQKKVGSSSRFQVMTIPDENLLSKSDGVPISDQHRGERVSRFQIAAVPEERLLSGQGDTPVSTKSSSSSSKPRFSVSRVPEDEVQLPAKVQRSLSTPTTSRFSVTSVEENEQKKEGTSYIRKPGDFPRGVATIPSNRYLQVPSHRRSSAGAGRTVSSISKPRSNRFTVQSLEDPLQNKQGDSKDTSLRNDSVGNTKVDSSIKSEEDKKTDKPTNATSSRFTVQRVPEEPQATQPKKLVGILKKFETLPDGTRSYTKQPDQPRFRRASEGASLDSPDDVTDGLPSSALTVHGYTSVRFWDEKRGKYSYESHL